MSKSVTGHVDTAQFRALAGKSSQLAPKVKTNLRRNLRGVGTVIVQDMQGNARSTPGTVSSEPRAHPWQLREDIAQGIKITLSTGAKAGIIIRATKGSLPPAQAAMLKAWEAQKGFRHRVYGGDTWVAQTGHPYFGIIARKHRDDATRAAVSALQEAANTLK